MSKYYKLYLNNNDKKCYYNSYDCELVDVIEKTRIKEVKDHTIFGIKKEIITEKFLDKILIVGEEVKGSIYDLITGKEVCCGNKKTTNSLGFNIYLEEKNNDYECLSYYKKQQLSPSEVVKILKELSDEDIIRYKDKITYIENISKINYQKNLELIEEKNKKQKLDENYINNFKKRCR